jgi:hypothetical protein
MAEVMIFSKIAEVYGTIISSLPSWLQIFINLFLVVILVVLYAFFVWKFYTSIAKKNILGLDLNKYNKSQEPFITKLLAGSLYFLEYIIILPFIIFIWFSILSLFLILLTDLTVQVILLISAVIVIATRMAAYYKESLAKDIGKLVPFTLLAIALLNPNFSSFQRVLENFQQLPTFLSYIFIYLLFIIIFEVFLRFFDFVISLFGLEETEEETAEKEEKTESE